MPRRRKPTTFTCFPDLPPEVRIKIWRLLTRETRLIDLRAFPWSADEGPIPEPYPGKDYMKSGCRPPVILQVCKESREEGLKIYKVVSFDVYPVGLFNPACDSFHIRRNRKRADSSSDESDDDGVGLNLESLTRRLHRDSVPFVQSITIDETVAEHNRRDGLWHLYRLTDVQRVTVVPVHVRCRSKKAAAAVHCKNIEETQEMATWGFGQFKAQHPDREMPKFVVNGAEVPVELTVPEDKIQERHKSVRKFKDSKNPAITYLKISTYDPGAFADDSD